MPLSARFFHPSGFGGFLGVTYLDQQGEFGAFNENGETVLVPGESNFWVVDAALRYRLPKRYGFLVAGVNNLTDERSTYVATDPKNLRFGPAGWSTAGSSSLSPDPCRESLFPPRSRTHEVQRR